MSWQYFSDEELQCRCCKLNKMDESFMKSLVRLRELAGFPFPINSAYRCPEHNRRISSSGMNGPHTTGKAVDISVNGPRAYQLVALALAQGFTGIGVSQRGIHRKRFIHLDKLEGANRPGVWSY